jgi:hypothetical protein
MISTLLCDLVYSPNMALAAKKPYQNTTVRLPRRVYDQAKTVIPRSQASSFNDFVVQAIEEKVQRLTEAEIDHAFAQMAHDAEYQHAAVQLAGEFEKSDWEAFASGKAEPTGHGRKKARGAKTNSR